MIKKSIRYGGACSPNCMQGFVKGCSKGIAFYHTYTQHFSKTENQWPNTRQFTANTPRTGR